MKHTISTSRVPDCRLFSHLYHMNVPVFEPIRPGRCFGDMSWCSKPYLPKPSFYHIGLWLVRSGFNINRAVISVMFYDTNHHNTRLPSFSTYVVELGLMQLRYHRADV